LVAIAKLPGTAIATNFFAWILATIQMRHFKAALKTAKESMAIA
jgi:hypothetical protein